MPSGLPNQVLKISHAMVRAAHHEQHNMPREILVADDPLKISAAKDILSLTLRLPYKDAAAVKYCLGSKPVDIFNMSMAPTLLPEALLVDVNQSYSELNIEVSWGLMPKVS